MMKPKIKFFLLPLLLAFGAVPLLFGEGPQVFVTPSGRRYHLETCSTLRVSRQKTALSLAEAAASGRLPCRVCNPPAPEGSVPAGEPDGESSGDDAPGTVSADGLYRVHLSPGLASSGGGDISRMLPASVSRHVDGDTVRVIIGNPPPGLGNTETIRMIGVDTPETVHPSRQVEYFGREASDYTKSRLLGRTVWLAFDGELRDRYGRLLCYIYTEEGCFNAELVREGYAHAYTRFPFRFLDEFRALEGEARAARRGLWAGE